MLERGREPQERPPPMCDDLPDSVEKEKPQPLRPGGPGISGQGEPLERREQVVREDVELDPGGVRADLPARERGGRPFVLEHVMGMLDGAGHRAVPLEDREAILGPIGDHREVVDTALIAKGVPWRFWTRTAR
jgi:hypothetical protein